MAINPLIKIKTFLILYFKTTSQVFSVFGQNSTKIGNFPPILKTKCLVWLMFLTQVLA